jgi:hypothetical protein
MYHLLDVEHARYAPFTATFPDIIDDYKSESLGPMVYGLSATNYWILLLLFFRGRSNCLISMM